MATDIEPDEPSTRELVVELLRRGYDHDATLSHILAVEWVRATDGARLTHSREGSHG